MSKLGFEEIYHNDWFTKKPDSDSIGVIIAQKEIELDEGSYTLRAVAIRGAGYESEYPDNQCKDFQPDPVRASEISSSDFDRCCATCRHYIPYCNVYEGIRYNDSPICHNYEKYHDYDW